MSKSCSSNCLLFVFRLCGCCRSSSRLPSIEKGSMHRLNRFPMRMCECRRRRRYAVRHSASRSAARRSLFLCSPLCFATNSICVFTSCQPPLLRTFGCDVARHYRNAPLPNGQIIMRPSGISYRKFLRSRARPSHFLAFSSRWLNGNARMQVFVAIATIYLRTMPQSRARAFR